MSEAFVIEPPPQVALPVAGGGRFPVRRIFCIGRNYADHVREMGGDPRSDPPVFFCKPADAAIPGGAIPYAAATDNLHFEGELVVALGGCSDGITSADEADALIYGYACGCDLTRRDLQAAAKKSGGPWDTAKGFDASAPVGPVLPRSQVAPADLASAELVTQVDGIERQRAPLASMIWSVPEVILALAALFRLQSGDLVFTGTPEGVGPLHRGAAVSVSVDGLPALDFSIT